MSKHDKIVVAQIVQHLKPGGIEIMVLDLLKHQPFQTVVISLEGTKQQAIEQWPMLEKVSDHLVFLDKAPGFQWSLIMKLRRLFKSLKVSAVHSHHIGPMLYGGIAAKLANISKHVHTEHDAWHLSNLKRRYLQRLLLALLKPIVVADAQAVVQKAESYLNRQDIQLIHNGIDVEKFTPGSRNHARKQFNLPTGVILLGNAGRLESVKGQDLLISAMAHFSSSVHLAIAGSGSCERALKQQAIDLNIEQQIHFLGPLDDMTRFYQSLDLFCFPSRCEGLPLSPMEAQACGIPVLISDVGGSTEALCHTTGLLVKRDSVEQIVKAIDIMLSRHRVTCPRQFISMHRNVKGMAKAYSKLIYAQS